LCNISLLKIIQDEGLGVDVSSFGELYTAKKAGVDLANVYMHGNNKPRKELEDAIDLNVGAIVVDNFAELETIGEITSKLKKQVKILFRVNPGIEAHTHEFIQTGQTDSKFGIAKEDILKAVLLALKLEYVDFAGLHAHIGSQIFDVNPFLAEIDVLADLARQINNELNYKVKEINIGGGLGIDYSGSDNVPSIDFFANKIVSHFKEKCADAEIGEPKLILEPGRSIIGVAGVTLYTVGNVKDIPGIRKYVSVDGGMADNPRPILYGAKYEATIANKASLPKNDKVTIVGRFCESGDKLLVDYELQKAEKGDVLAVLCTGAYNYSMASNYNRVGRPAMILVNNGNAKLIVKRETHEDLAQNDVG
ncbi:diaminopimelate decarboxylase, partial [candidate division WOR-1 bacterium RIFOXYC2_FULL_37_10]